MGKTIAREVADFADKKLNSNFELGF